jgi:hypothetical protein
MAHSLLTIRILLLINDRHHLKMEVKNMVIYYKDTGITFM